MYNLVDCAERILVAQRNVMEEELVVTVAQGQLQGFRNKFRGNREYVSFLGVPYAEPPLGPLRFKVRK